MPKRDFAEVIQEICDADDRYSNECYTFVREGLDHTLKYLKRAGVGPKSHVTGGELLDGLREYALSEFGPMTKSVLNEWGIKKCEDFGEVVFNLVKHGVLGKTDTDSLNDFKGGFSFHEAFVKPFRPIGSATELTPASATRPRAPRKNKPANAKPVKAIKAAKKSGTSQA